MWTNEGPAIWLTANMTETVPEGDPKAAFLLVAAGGQLPLEEAERYGLTSERKAAAEKANKLKADSVPNKAKG